MREEKLMKQLCNEMGIEWVEGNHEPMINGVPCEELDISASEKQEDYVELGNAGLKWIYAQRK